MNFDPRYTIEFIYSIQLGNDLMCGEWIDVLTGATIVGDYCMWPKQEPRRFVVTNDGYDRYAIEPKVIFKETDDKIKFYQKLNRKKWYLVITINNI